MSEIASVIIGTLSGFIIAFFAEPVKNYFQNKAKIHHLRIALYSELINNYYVLTHHTMKGDSNDAYPLYHVPKYELRTECYKHALQNELSVFYQLKEANALNIIYGRVNQLINLNSDLSAIYGERGLNSASSVFTQHSNTLKYMFTKSFQSKMFDAMILRKLVAPQQYKEIMEKGKEHVEANATS